MRYLVVLAVAVSAAVAQEICLDLPAASNFTFPGFLGTWYEIGKIQTAGGAFWQEGCVCNTMDISLLDEDTGNSQANYKCRDYYPTGDETSFQGQLLDMQMPGKWEQEVFPGLPRVSWTVLVLGDDYAMTYDCGETLFSYEYCVHIVSRTPNMTPERRDQLVQMAEDMGLNPYNRNYDEISHDSCW